MNVALPKYKFQLPVSKVNAEYRPFTVREGKILLLAQEENTVEAITDAVNQIISNCTFGKHSIKTLNKTDAEMLFVKIRNKSMGEGVDVRAKCKECAEKTPMTMNLDEVKVTNADKKIDSIELMDGLWVTMKYPTIEESLKIENDGTMAIVMALDTIIDGENSKSAADFTIEERVDFVESLTQLQIAKFKPYFDNFPILVLDIDYVCKNGHKNTIHVEGIENFFG